MVNGAFDAACPSKNRERRVIQLKREASGSPQFSKGDQAGSLAAPG
jgi:hypothetical protein